MSISSRWSLNTRVSPTWFFTIWGLTSSVADRTDTGSWIPKTGQNLGRDGHPKPEPRHELEVAGIGEYETAALADVDPEGGEIA